MDEPKAPPAPKDPKVERVETSFLDPEVASLIELGYFQWSDAMFLAVGAGGFATLLAWWVFARPDYAQIAVALLLLVILLGLWIVTLIYRTSYFVLKMRAVMETMPEQAAKIAFAIHSANVGNPGTPAEKPADLPQQY